MKKILKSRLLLVIVTMLLSITGSILATTSIMSNQVIYNNEKTAETTVKGSLDELFSTVDINERLGNTDKISSIGDGTVSGAISTLNNAKQNKIINFNRAMYVDTDSYGMAVLTIDISKYGFTKVPATAFLQAQFRAFQKYQYNMESSTSDELQFWVWYDTSLASQSVLNRYGVLIVT